MNVNKNKREHSRKLNKLKLANGSLSLFANSPILSWLRIAARKPILMDSNVHSIILIHIQLLNVYHWNSMMIVNQIGDFKSVIFAFQVVLKSTAESTALSAAFFVEVSQKKCPHHLNTFTWKSGKSNLVQISLKNRWSGLKMRSFLPKFEKPKVGRSFFFSPLFAKWSHEEDRYREIDWRSRFVAFERNCGAFETLRKVGPASHSYGRACKSIKHIRDSLPNF